MQSIFYSAEVGRGIINNYTEADQAHWLSLGTQVLLRRGPNKVLTLTNAVRFWVAGQFGTRRLQYQGTFLSHWAYMSLTGWSWYANTH